MKKIFALLLTAMMLFSFTACGDDSNSSKKSSSKFSSEPITHDNTNDSEPYEEICPICDGEGTWDCACGGNPETIPCPGLCGGDGKKECTSCNGKGTRIVYPDPVNPDPVNPDPVNPDPVNPDPYPESSCYHCNNKGVRTCSYCNGAGKIENVDYAPNYGSGSNKYVTYTTCYHCHGNRVTDCPYC